MVDTFLKITRRDQEQQLLLDGTTVLIGRDPKCDLTLESSRVSRHHARLFCDPFDRWIIEDLQSTHGVNVDNQRIEALALQSGQAFGIGPFTLSIQEAVSTQIPPDESADSTVTHLEMGGDVQVTESVSQPTALSQPHIQQLNQITQALESLSTPTELYPCLCGGLADTPQAMALILRLDCSAQPESHSPQVLCRHVNGEQANLSEFSVHLSKRVIEQVLAHQRPVMARSVQSGGDSILLTVVDEQAPRVVACVPVSDWQETVDVLYMDVPQDRTGDDWLGFIEAVATQARFARKGLLLLKERVERQAIDRQLTMARDIQTKLIPEQCPSLAGVDAALYYQPAMWVGGDYCDMWLVPDGRLAFAVGDVTGKGLAAALVMTNLHAAFRIATQFCDRVDEVANQINQHFIEHLSGGKFVTLFFGIFDPDTGQLDYVNAGHIPPLAVSPEGQTSWFETATNTVLGISDESMNAHQLTLPPGTGLLIVTDGITEAADVSGEQFGLERMQQALDNQQNPSAKCMVETVLKTMEAFQGTLPPGDDVTLLGLMRQSVV